MLDTQNNCLTINLSEGGGGGGEEEEEDDDDDDLDNH